MLYYFNASRNYNPDPDLEKIKAKVLYINSADDVINPPELGIAEREIKRVKDGKFVLLPITDQTRGHGTHSLPAIWQTISLGVAALAGALINRRFRLRGCKKMWAEESPPTPSRVKKRLQP